MIKTLKAATNLPELIFVCQQYGIRPVFTESLFLGLTLTKVMYNVYPEHENLALLDSNTLLEVVAYDNETELTDYKKKRGFEDCFAVDREGVGTPIE